MLSYFGRNFKISKKLFCNSLQIVNQTSKVRFCKNEDKSEGDSDVSSLRHNFHPECEDALNEQINCELYASYTYFCMSNCLSRPDVGLPGYASFFAAASAEERDHAQQIAQFINTRGGTVSLCDVLRPDPGEYHGPEAALEESMLLEKIVLKNLEELHKKANSHGDVFLTDWLESTMIPEQYRGLRQLAEMLTRVRVAGAGPGIILLDLDLQRHPPSPHS